MDYKCVKFKIRWYTIILELHNCNESSVQYHEKPYPVSPLNEYKITTLLPGLLLKAYFCWSVCLRLQGEGHLSQIDCVHSLVVDEADRMVEKGHYEELTKLLALINEWVHTF